MVVSLGVQIFRVFTVSKFNGFVIYMDDTEDCTFL